MTDDLVQRLRGLHVWPQSTADTYPDVLGPRRIKALYEVGEVAHEAAAEIETLRAALADLLHAVCGKTGFAETVRRDSGRIYPWPALDLAEAKALEALERSK